MKRQINLHKNRENNVYKKVMKSHTFKNRGLSRLSEKYRVSPAMAITLLTNWDRSLFFVSG